MAFQIGFLTILAMAAATTTMMVAVAMLFHNIKIDIEKMCQSDMCYCSVVASEMSSIKRTKDMCQNVEHLHNTHSNYAT